MFTTEHYEQNNFLDFEGLQQEFCTISFEKDKATLTSLQKGNFLTTETTEITETKDNFIFR